ncbi:GNAT family N-acetyltransferase [Erwinia tasmaniensis]|uniref:Acetyltransferase, GNAT family n=1 Tax=Erwinia tasmaniensis (strain DSM 17950 / CFBP 7177 / CIP 109463 / NCPPB 4357 / Et1/99) TaxID=465817 RepID=B2VKI1_ERWT9|nr:GNAT family N-acetyltransferase [Erwinia tasmaniensis]CAO96742.1 Acetyltransferase, GNAT family [Erwinia tasmaniensis Et1/99]
MSATLTDMYHQAENYFFEGIAVKCVVLNEGCRAYMTGDAGLNFIYLRKEAENIDDVLVRGRQFFEQYDLSFDVIIAQDLCCAQVMDVLNAMGFVQSDKSVSMVLDLDTFEIDKAVSSDVSTTIGAHDDCLSDWISPLVSAFESTHEACSSYAARHENASKKNINFSHYSLYENEKIVASMTLSLNKGIARIDDVGTLPEHQGKGYATHLINYALSVAKGAGAHHCFLEASDDGLSVYHKLGFEPLFIDKIFSTEA